MCIHINETIYIYKQKQLCMYIDRQRDKQTRTHTQSKWSKGSAEQGSKNVKIQICAR